MQINDEVQMSRTETSAVFVLVSGKGRFGTQHHSAERTCLNINYRKHNPYPEPNIQLASISPTFTEPGGYGVRKMQPLVRTLGRAARK